MVPSWFLRFRLFRWLFQQTKKSPTCSQAHALFQDGLNSSGFTVFSAAVQSHQNFHTFRCLCLAFLQDLAQKCSWWQNGKGGKFSKVESKDGGKGNVICRVVGWKKAVQKQARRSRVFPNQQPLQTARFLTFQSTKAASDTAPSYFRSHFTGATETKLWNGSGATFAVMDDTLVGKRRCKFESFSWTRQ